MLKEWVKEVGKKNEIGRRRICFSFFLNPATGFVILTSMTRKNTTPHTKKIQQRPRLPKTGLWPLQDAKARFSEVVRRVLKHGPQHVTVHGRDEVVIVSTQEFRRLKGEQKGDLLIAAMQSAPVPFDLERQPMPMPVREVDV